MSTTGIFLLLATALLTMAANLLLRAGIDAAGGFSIDGVGGLVRGLVHLFLQPRFTLGFVLYALASVVWFRVVATEPLSVAYPILVSLTFGLVTAGALIFFGEPLSVRKVVGLVTILGGIMIISTGTGST
jgi:multidrug transporter EmrE-like cation transporter